MCSIYSYFFFVCLSFLLSTFLLFHVSFPCCCVFSPLDYTCNSAIICYRLLYAPDVDVTQSPWGLSAARISQGGRQRRRDEWAQKLLLLKSLPTKWERKGRKMRKGRNYKHPSAWSQSLLLQATSDFCEAEVEAPRSSGVALPCATSHAVKGFEQIFTTKTKNIVVFLGSK